MLNKCQGGFSLIELMVVVVIIGLLASIAVPSYQSYLIRGKLAEATAGLADGRVRMEQFYQDSKDWSLLDNTCKRADGIQVVPSSTDSFTFACDNLSSTTYRITATGKADTPVAAYGFTINESNTRTSTTPWGNSASCWVVKKGGEC